MKVLVACEFSGIVRDAFIARGHDAMSCDLLPTERPGPHYRGDVMDIINDGFDLMIGHPPCTYLCRQSARWYADDDGRTKIEAAAAFFLKVLRSGIEKIAIENPIPHKYASELIKIKYDQIIQPFQFGHDYSKKTCLWLKNLPKLQPTKVVEVTHYITPNGRKFTSGWYFTPRNSIARSRTFQGIAEAMAEQWSNL